MECIVKAMLAAFRFALSALLAALVFAGSYAQETPATEEIPIGRCDRLPTVDVQADGKRLRFLLDTAATSLLNEKSFAPAQSKEIRVSSWTGTTVTKAHEVHIKELILGSYRLKDIRLSAINLNPISKACGGPIDGILGIDLLEKMGATIDLQRRVALLQPKPGNPTESQRLKEYQAFTTRCVDAFNRADASGLGKCFDPNILHYTTETEIQGRGQVMDFYDRNFFHADPPALIHVEIKAGRVLADMAWSAFEYSIILPDRTIRARATMMSRKLEGKWVIVSLHESLLQ